MSEPAKWPDVWQAKPPRSGNAPGVEIENLGLVDVGCVGTIAFNNLHCLLCPEMEACILAAAEEQKVYKPKHYRTRSDIPHQLDRKPRNLQVEDEDE